MPFLTTGRRRADGSPTARARALFKSHPKPTPALVTAPAAPVSAPQARRGSFSPSVASSSSSSSEACSSTSSSQGSIARLLPADVHQVPLAHLRAAVAAAVDHAPRRRTAHVDVVLAEDRVFVRPPARRSHRWEDDWDAPPAADSGPSVLHGLIIVSSPDRRSVDDVVVSLTAHQSLALKRQVADDRLTGPPEEFELSRRELSLATALDESRIELEKGVNCFAFEFHLPSSTPPSVCSSYGRLRYILRTALPGSSSLLKGRLSSRTEIVVVAIPPSREDAGELRFSAKRSVTAAWSGPEAHVVELAADQMILSAPLTIGLTLPAPPPSLTILGLRSFVAQTVLMRSVDGEEQVVQSPRRLVALHGRRQGWEKHADDWIAGVGKSAGDEDVVFDGRAWAGGEWKTELAGVVPQDNTVRPTTLSSSGGSAPGLHFAAELVVEALVSPAVGAPTEVVTLWRGKVDLASAHCSAEALTLPAYAA